MSIETSIAALMASLNSALALPQQISDLAAAKVADIGNAYQSRINTLNMSFYIDSIAGDDANDGSQAHPKKTLNAALIATPMGGVCNIYLVNDYAWSDQINLNGRQVNFRSVGTRKSLKPIASTLVINSTNYRTMGSFAMSNGAAIKLYGVDIVIPSAPAGSEGYPYYGSAILFQGSGADVSRVFLLDVALNLPATPTAPLFYQGDAIIFVVYAMTAPNQPYLGKIINNITNSAGTSTSTLPYLVTNLLLI